MKEYRARLTPEAAQFISRLHPDNKKVIREAIDDLRKMPYAGDELQDDLNGFKSYKPRRFRILYKIDEENGFINVFYVGHRRDVYDQFRRFLTGLKENE
jgi:mRNA interferase RelE/StbE